MSAASFMTDSLHSYLRTGLFRSHLLSSHFGGCKESDWIWTWILTSSLTLWVVAEAGRRNHWLLSLLKLQFKIDCWGVGAVDDDWSIAGRSQSTSEDTGRMVSFMSNCCCCCCCCCFSLSWRFFRATSWQFVSHTHDSNEPQTSFARHDWNPIQNKSSTLWKTFHTVHTNLTN